VGFLSDFPEFLIKPDILNLFVQIPIAFLVRQYLTKADSIAIDSDLNMNNNN
jgi:hypothetical protein